MPIERIFVKILIGLTLVAIGIFAFIYQSMPLAGMGLVFLAMFVMGDILLSSGPPIKDKKAQHPIAEKIVLILLGIGTFSLMIILTFMLRAGRFALL